MAADPVSYLFTGDPDRGFPTYEELKRRRAIALALASRQKGFPKNVGEGLTYLGEAIGERIGDWRLSAAEKAREGQIATERAGVLGGGVPAVTPAVTSTADTAPAVTSSAAAPPATADAAPAVDGGGLGGGGGGTPVAVTSPPPTTPPLPSTLPPEPPRAPVVAADPGPGSPQGRINEAFGDVGRQPLRPLPPPPAAFADRFGAATPPRQPLPPPVPPPASFADRFDAVGGSVAPMSTQPTPEQAFSPRPAMGAPPPPTAAPIPVTPPAKPVAAAPVDEDPIARFGRGIAGIESGGAKDPYSLVGARTKSGDRAMGKYQIMGANVPSWTEAALGKRLTPQQFLASPAAQEATFRDRFGKYVDKYGPEGAARAWYAGEGGMKNLGATDVHGRLTVAGYGKDFLKRIGGDGGDGPIVVPGSRDAIALAAMPRARPAPAAGGGDGLLAEVAGMNALSAYAPTAALGRDDVATDAPVPGASPVGAISAPGIGRTLQTRRGGQLPPLPVQAPPPDPNVPPAMRPIPGSVAPPPGSGPVPPAPPPIAPPPPVSGPLPPQLGMNLPPVPEAAAVAPAPAPAAQGIRAMPVMSDAAPIAAPVGAQLAQAKPAPTRSALPPLPPGLQPIPMPRFEAAPVHPVEERAKAWAAQYPNDPDRQAQAQKIYGPLEERRNAEDKQRLEAWKVQAQASKDRDKMIAEYYRDYEKNQAATASSRVQAQRAQQDIIPAVPNAGQTDPSLLGTPRSPQRTGIPTPPPAPPGVSPEAWSKLQAPQLAKAVEAVERAGPQFSEMLRAIELAKTHPGRELGIGATGKVARQLPWTDAAGFGKIVDQLAGKNFLAAYETLKGGGAISEAEGAKAEQAQARISPDQKKEDFDAGLRDLETTVRRSLEQAQRKVNQPVTAWQRGPNDPPAPDIGQVDSTWSDGKVRQYIGGDPRDKTGSWKVIR